MTLAHEPTTLLIPLEEPNAAIRALNNAYFVLKDFTSGNSHGPEDAVANCVMHEVLDALADLKRSPPRCALCSIPFDCWSPKGTCYKAGCPNPAVRVPPEDLPVC